MKEMKVADFIPAIETSADVGFNSGVFDEPKDVEIVVQDEDGNEYYIEDVVFDTDSGLIAIKFNHDNE